MSEPSSLAQPAGVIHDIGYQRYTGPRLGRRYVAGSLYVHGLRTAFGLGRSSAVWSRPYSVRSARRPGWCR